VNVIEAIESRISCRAFLDTAVPLETIREILDLARLAPSGGNIQPWHVHVVAGKKRQELVDRAIASFTANPDGEQPREYLGYPVKWVQPYKTRRFDVGKALYSALGIDRRDKTARGEQMLRNFYFFDAPVGLMFTIHKTLWPGQLNDLGIFMGNVILLAREFGLHTCAQGFWQNVNRTVHEVLEIPYDYIIYSGMALGHIDPNHPANQVKSGRGEVDDFATFMGFDD